MLFRVTNSSRAEYSKTGFREIIYEGEDIDNLSRLEIQLQKQFGYRVDEIPYNELKFNNKEMNINIIAGKASPLARPREEADRAYNEVQEQLKKIKN